MKCIVGAMEEEIKDFFNLVDEYKETKVIGMNKFHICNHNKKDLIIFSSGIGKTNAGASIMNCINNFKIDLVINIGLAGSCNSTIHSGDIVMSKNSLYLDVNATAFGYKNGQIPREKLIFEHTKQFQKNFLKNQRKQYNKHLVNFGTSDTFISSISEFKKFQVPMEENIDVVDMETNAFAHILSNYQIPFLTIRAISDSIYEQKKSADQFLNNLSKYALRCKKEVIKLI